jgi:hypothetical protein
MEAKAARSGSAASRCWGPRALGLLATGTGTAGLVLMLAGGRAPGGRARVTGLYAARRRPRRTGIERLARGVPADSGGDRRNVKENLGWLKTRVRSARR